MFFQTLNLLTNSRLGQVEPLSSTRKVLQFSHSAENEQLPFIHKPFTSDHTFHTFAPQCKNPLDLLLITIVTSNLPISQMTVEGSKIKAKVLRNNPKKQLKEVKGVNGMKRAKVTFVGTVAQTRETL